MTETPPRGFFLTIEGIEGAGKSTLAEALAQQLRSAGREVIITREPGGTVIGDEIRRLLLESRGAMSNRAELLLFEAARAQHVDEVIVPALDRGAFVICDRFADSSLAYQNGARGIDSATVRSLNGFATAGLMPELTILLDLPVEAGLARQRSLDRISSEGLAFHESVRAGYLAIAKAEPNRVMVVDGSRDLSAVLDEVRDAVDRALMEVGQ